MVYKRLVSVSSLTKKNSVPENTNDGKVIKNISKQSPTLVL